MRKNAALRKLGALLAALLLVCSLALPALAASAAVEDVLALLGTLQRADINPAWQPDIAHNESSVQRLLDLYLACTTEEKAEFTTQQNSDLHAYFTALYRVQGRDAAEVDALFTEDTAPPPDTSQSTPPPDSSVSVPDDSSSASSSGSASSGGTSSTTSLPSGTSSSAPVGGGTSATTPDSGGALPPAPGGGSIFENRGLGSILLVVLLALAVILAIRFIVALRKAGPAPKDDLETEELFGEGYVPELNAPDDETPPGPPPGESTPEAALPPTAGQAAPLQREDAAPTRPGPVEPATPVAPSRRPAPKPEKPPARLRPEDFQGERFPDALLPEAPPEPPVSNDISAKTSAGNAPQKIEEKSLENTPASAAQPTGTQPPIGNNPDRRNSITMRSFSGPPRNGRPPKMPFRQGDPDDLDAIDE
ncbi:hypothetical protein LJC04_01545 [Ruminococcaceae bacterium OttesenSCG-928-O06]|nr:hypothetical protein [Ruminococcaceae bacterium OttesenSCG-928-O06]